MTLIISTIAFAAGMKQTIEVIFNDVSLAVNGNQVKTDTITYNGDVYVSVKALADVLGKDLVEDQKTGIINIKDKVVTNPTANYSRTNPAPIGVAQSIRVENLMSDSTLEITVKEVVRGAKADEMIKKSNKILYFEPDQGYENLLVKIKVKALDVKDDKKVDVNQAIFDIYTDKYEKYETKLVIAPEPRLNTSLYKGAETEGWAAYVVKVGDNPRLVYGQKYDGTGGIWFKLSK